MAENHLSASALHRFRRALPDFSSTRALCYEDPRKFPLQTAQTQLLHTQGASLCRLQVDALSTGMFANVADKKMMDAVDILPWKRGIVVLESRGGLVVAPTNHLAQTSLAPFC